MRVAVMGGTGLVGGYAVRALERDGHEPVVVARSPGVDVTTGTGLDEALSGVEAVIDVTNTAAQDVEAARAFFAATTERLLAGELGAGVSHHVVLSIVGLDRVEGNAHYAGKRLQEEIAAAGPPPITIMRATQLGRAPDLAGPEPQDLVDMARRPLAARGQAVRLVPSWRDGPFGVEMAGEVMLPGPDARLAPTTFDAWLASDAVRGDD